MLSDPHDDRQAPMVGDVLQHGVGLIGSGVG